MADQTAPEILARVASEHLPGWGRSVYGPREWLFCQCDPDHELRGWDVDPLLLAPDPWPHYRAHLSAEQAKALRAAGMLLGDGALIGEPVTEWAVVDNGRVIHILGATNPADALAGAHAHGPIGVAHRQVWRTEWTELSRD